MFLQCLQENEILHVNCVSYTTDATFAGQQLMQKLGKCSNVFSSMQLMSPTSNAVSMSPFGWLFVEHVYLLQRQKCADTTVIKNEKFKITQKYLK